MKNIIITVTILSILTIISFAAFNKNSGVNQNSSVTLQNCVQTLDKLKSGDLSSDEIKGLKTAINSSNEICKQVNNL